MDDLTRHFAPGPSGTPAGMAGHDARYDAGMSELQRRRLVGPHGMLETGHVLIPDWDHRHGQWMGTMLHPSGSSAWQREGEYHDFPLGTVDSEVPDRVAQHFRTPEFFDYVRRTMK